MSIIKPYTLQKIESFENPDMIYDTPDLVSMPRPPTSNMSANISSPLSNYTYNAPTVSPITLAPTLSPMEAAIKDINMSGSSAALLSYKTKPSIFSAPSSMMPSMPPSSMMPSMPPSSMMPSMPPSSMMPSMPPSSMMSSMPPSSMMPSMPPSSMMPSMPPQKPIIESFYGSKLEDLKNDRILLKCVLYALLFYFLANEKVLKYVGSKLPKFDPLVINMIIFIVILLILNSQL
jgi:hypothetical protein